MVWGGVDDEATYQVEAEEQRAESRDEQDVDEVAGQVAEPRSGIHGSGVEGWW